MNQEREKRLRELARNLVWLQDSYEKASISEKELMKDEMNELRATVVKEGFSADLFIQYMEEYKNMSVEEYMEVYKK